MSKILVPLAEGCEELEAVTIIDLLRRAGFTVTVAGLYGTQAIKASRGVWLAPDVALSDVLHESFDMLVLPGGQPGTNNLKADPCIIECVRQMAAQGKFVAAVCAAPSVLAAAGLLDGRQATSYPGSLDAYPQVHQQAASVVVDGKLITSRGPGTAMDFALTLIELLGGSELRSKVEGPLQRPV